MNFILLIIPWCLAGIACFLAYGFLCQIGRILLRLDAIEQELTLLRIKDPQPSETPTTALPKPTEISRSLANSRINRDGLAPGTRVPYFIASRIDQEGTISTAEYANRRFLLVLTTNECTPCDDLFHTLCSLPRVSASEAFVVIGRGSREQLVNKIASHTPSFPVAIQDGWEISRALGMFRFPCAYLIDETGHTVGPVMVGPDPILQAAHDVLRRDELRGDDEHVHEVQVASVLKGAEYGHAS